MRSLEFENDDLFGEPGSVYRGAAADINEYSNPLGEFHVSNTEYENLHSILADATGYNWTDDQYEALVTPLYDTVDEPLADFFDNVLNDNPRAESDRFVDQLISILQSNYQRYGTEPRTAIDGVIRALERGYRIAHDMWGDDVEIDESDDDLFEPRSGLKFYHNPSPEYEQLYGQLVPAQGPASTLEGELLRAASRLYYQYVNNGLQNNVSGAENFIRQFAELTPAMQRALYTIHPYTRCDVQDLENKQTAHQVEIALDIILQGVIRQVQAANGAYHPNTNDKYDMFDYGEPDDVEPEDDYDGYEEPDEDDDEDLAESYYHISDFKINSYESMADFRKWMRGPKTSDRGMTRHVVDIYENMMVNDHVLAESNQAFVKRKQQAKAFSDNFKKFDERDKVQIKLGNKIALLSSTVIPDDKSSRIELSGFTTPKKIVKINLDNEDKIDSIKFHDGTTFPEAAEFTTVGGMHITNTIFFTNGPSAAKAYTAIWMYISKLEGQGWKVERYMSEGVAEGYTQHRFDEPLTGWHIVSKAHGQVVRGTPSFETKDQAQKYLMTRMFANHHEYKVVHTAGVAEGLEQISIKVRNGRNKFATELSVDRNPAGVYQYDANSGRSIAEVYPEYKGKGFGKILVLHAIYTAAKLGMDFVEDESRTAEYDNVLDSLDSNGLAVNDDGYWYVTGEGEQYLKQCLKQGVAEGSEEDGYSDKFVQSQIDYYKKHRLSGNAGDRERINGSLNYYQHIKNKRIKDGTWSLEQGVAEGSDDLFAPGRSERVAKVCRDYARRLKQQSEHESGQDAYYLSKCADRIDDIVELIEAEGLPAGIEAIHDLSSTKFEYDGYELINQIKKKTGLDIKQKFFEADDDLFQPSDRMKILHAIRGMRRGGDINGTSLQGEVITTYAHLLKTFGPPQYGPDEPGYDKVSCEWVITFGDGAVATIYDWKTGRATPRGEYRWHIGGHRKVVAEYVRVALDLGRDAMVTEDDDLFGPGLWSYYVQGPGADGLDDLHGPINNSQEAENLAQELVANAITHEYPSNFAVQIYKLPAVRNPLRTDWDEDFIETGYIPDEHLYKSIPIRASRKKKAGDDVVSESDDDLFEPRSGHMPPETVAKIMPAVNHFMQRLGDDDDLIRFKINQEEPEVYPKIMRDFQGAALELSRGNVIRALAFLENSPMQYDLDDWFMNAIYRQTGIDLSDYYDDDDPRHDRLFRKYHDAIKALREYGMSEFMETNMREVREFVEWTRSVVTENQDDDLFEPTVSPMLLKLYKKLDKLCKIGQRQRYMDYDYDVDELMLRSSETWEEIFDRLDGNYDTTVRDIIAAATPEERQQLIEDMSYYIEEIQNDLDLTESDRKKKTQTRTDQPGLDPDMFAPRPDQPLARQEPKKDKAPDQPRDIRRASAARTRQATAGITPTDQMRDMLGRLRNIEIDPDLPDYAAHEPTQEISVDVNTKNLPAVAGANMQAAGIQNPEFFQVAALPGNMAAVIRQLGKKLFGAMTATPTNNIYVVANLGGQGPNTTQEVNAVAGYLRDHGTNIGPGNIDFSKIMPGYSAETNMFSAGGIRWLLVRDFAGQYIYAWPESDSVDHAQEPKKLR